MKSWEGRVLPAVTVLAALILTPVFQLPLGDLEMLVLPKSMWGEGEVMAVA